MTPKEREKPGLLNAKRKIRIAKGSGTTVQDVNRVIKMHQEMEGAMKKIRKMGGLKGLAAMFGGGGGGGDGGMGGLGGGKMPTEDDIAGLLGGGGGKGIAGGLPGLPGGLPPGFQNFNKKK
jgi:signal recognition particle subunit SRP54